MWLPSQRSSCSTRGALGPTASKAVCSWQPCAEIVWCGSHTVMVRAVGFMGVYADSDEQLMATGSPMPPGGIKDLRSVAMSAVDVT